jgi:hypothetical protein
MVVTPEGWYIAFWLSVGVVALTPIYVLLYLIWTK